MHTENWHQSDIQTFWGEIAPCDHLVQIYENDSVFLSTLEGFAGAGLLSGDSVVVIATKPHLDELNYRLANHGFDLESLCHHGQYMPIDGHEALSRFMVHNWPEEELFNLFVLDIIQRASVEQRKIRAFGEMVAVLWLQGLTGATFRLEQLWHQLHSLNPFSLFCAYPKHAFSHRPQENFDKICQAHSKVIDGRAKPATQIYYNSF